MHGVVRTYSGKGAAELFAFVEKNHAGVEEAMRNVKGFQSYTLMRTADGGVAVTICDDKAGTEQSAAAAREWLAKNTPGFTVTAPTVSEGTVIIHAS
jgi:hypothetical protein